MKLTDIFIRRPVLAMMISITVTLMGLISLYRLPINRYPQITPPAVQVIAVYPGASAEDVATAVAAPIERQLAGLDGLLYYSSSNSSDGVMNLSAYFDISRDQDLAAVDVQNAINLAQSQLTNLASAESQIRDADLAAQAALNLSSQASRGRALLDRGPVVAEW